LECTPSRPSPKSTSPAATSRRQGAAPLHRADGKAGKVEIARGIHARHLGRLAADQRASRLPAALGDAFDHLRGFWTASFPVAK
jgi:hypothetical protein